MKNSDNNQNNCVSSDISALSSVEVLGEFAPLVKSRAKNFTSNESEIDDLIQEGNIGLLSAYKKYDSSLSGFTTFARRCIDSAIIDYLRKCSKLSRVPESMQTDYDDTQVTASVDPEYALSVKEEYLGIVEKAKQELSELEFAIFSDMLRGFTYSEISDIRKLNAKSVSNAVARIRAKLK